MAEIEIGILNRQSLDRRLADRQTLRHKVEHWQLARNATKQTIQWKFTVQAGVISGNESGISRICSQRR